MKKSILLLIPLVLGLASCGGPSIPNQETVDKVKEILSKQDLSEFHSKGMATMYTQEYDVLDIEKDEDEKVTNYFNYLGLGFLDFYYNLSADEHNSIVNEKGDINTFDALSIGEGGYRITQRASTASFTKNNTDYPKMYNLDINQQMTLKSTKDNVLVYNILDVTDDGTFQYEDRQYLNASINKELLFSSVSTRSFREIFSKVDLFDTPGNVEHIDKLYFSICRNLVSKDDREISDFIIKNQISIDEEDDIKLNFVFTNEDVEEDEVDYIFPGEIKGTLIFNKSTYEFSEFSYTIQNKTEVSDEDTGNSKIISMLFSCSGKSLREPIGEMWTKEDPTVYEDVSEFLKNVGEQVVPPNLTL